jgi:hypothetical protein
VQTGQVLLTIEGGGQCVAFSPDGKQLALGSQANALTVRDAHTGRQ